MNSCIFIQRDGETLPDGRPVRRCACGKKWYGDCANIASNCRLSQPNSLDEIDCLHLQGISPGEAGCCGSVRTVDVGNCSIVGQCTLAGDIIDGTKTTSCTDCKFKTPKG